MRTATVLYGESNVKVYLPYFSVDQFKSLTDRNGKIFLNEDSVIFLFKKRNNINSNYLIVLFMIFVDVCCQLFE